MPRFGSTFDENSVPPWTRGDLRVGLGAGCPAGLAKPITTTP
jgi:hypothetical protein